MANPKWQYPGPPAPTDYQIPDSKIQRSNKAVGSRRECKPMARNGLTAELFARGNENCETIRAWKVASSLDCFDLFAT